MGRKSEYSDDTQRNTVSCLMEYPEEINNAVRILDPSPSKRTVQRWVDRWKPILEAEKIADIKRRKSAEKGHKRHKTPTVTQNFKGAHAAWQGIYPAIKKRFERYNYGNYLDLTKVVNDYFEQKDVDKK